MKKVFLVIQLIERGMGSDDRPVMVFASKSKAEEYASRIYGYVKELDYVEDLY